MRRWPAASLAALFTTMVWATDPVTLRSLFPQEADVFADGPGLVRLDLPPEVVAACLPSLADLRLFDPGGSEVPFLLDTPRVESVFVGERVEVHPQEARREEVPRANGPSLRHETFELDGPKTAPRGGEWRLVVDVAQTEFVARAEVSWSRPSGGPQGLATGSLFRLTSPRPVEKLSLPLDGGSIARVRITLTHEHPFWLTPSFHFESSRTIDRSARSAIPLSIVGTHTSGGATVIELTRPRGVVPAVLRLNAQTATFDRKITVHDEGPGRDAAPLGEAKLFRLMPGSGVEELDLPLRRPRGDRLRVVIDDGDSPPLAAPSFTAVFSRPSLVASLTGEGGAAPAAVLRFGGGRANVPRYDLAGFSPGPGREVYGKRAEALIRLYDPSGVHEARLSPVRANPAFDRTPALSFAMRPGAAIDARSFARRRTLHVKPSAEGLTRVRLAPEDLASLRADLGDVRIVDPQSHQWPYLLEAGDTTADVPLAVAASSKDRGTTYKLSTPVSPFAINRLVIDSDVPFFDREYQLTGAGEDDREIVLSRGRLARTNGDPMPVTIDVGTTRVSRLALRIEDGDDAPLALGPFRARVPVADLFVAAPEGTYALLLGDPDAAAPSYELARVRDVVLAVASDEAGSEPIEKNPAYKLGARLTQGKGPERTLLWAALIAVVVILGALTLKLARQGPR